MVFAAVAIEESFDFDSHPSHRFPAIISQASKAYCAYKPWATPSIKIRGRDGEQNEDFKHCTNVREHEFIILNANLAGIEDDSRGESTVEIAEVPYDLLQDVDVFTLMV